MMQTRTIELTRTVTLETIVCCACDVVFAVPQELRARWRVEGTTFYCPNGHPQWYGESEADKLRRELTAKIAAQDQAEAEIREYAARLKAERASHQQTAKDLAAERREARRIQRRIANGVCPCCNRTFQNVMRHMKGQHPAYVVPTT